MTRSNHARKSNDPVWIAFKLWADKNGVGENEEDWLLWWECFLAGVVIGEAEAGL